MGNGLLSGGGFFVSYALNFVRLLMDHATAIPLTCSRTSLSRCVQSSPRDLLMRQCSQHQVAMMTRKSLETSLVGLKEDVASCSCWNLRASPLRRQLPLKQVSVWGLPL